LYFGQFRPAAGVPKQGTQPWHSTFRRYRGFSKRRDLEIFAVAGSIPFKSFHLRFSLTARLLKWNDGALVLVPSVLPASEVKTILTTTSLRDLSCEIVL